MSSKQHYYKQNKQPKQTYRNITDTQYPKTQTNALTKQQQSNQSKQKSKQPQIN